MYKLITQSFNVPIVRINDFWQSIKGIFDENTYFMIENYCEDSIPLGLFLEKGYLQDNWPSPPYLWPSGFIFNEYSEFSWRYEFDNFLFRFVQQEVKLQKILMPDIDIELKEKEIPYEEINKAEYLCWGTYNEDLNKWFEGQIPRLISYPVDVPKEYPFLIVSEYFKEKELICSCFSGVEAKDDIKSN